MKHRTLVITGATSAIAQALAKEAAILGRPLVLIGRDEAMLKLITNDLSIRYQASCTMYVVDFSHDISLLLKTLAALPMAFDLLLAHTLMISNEALSTVNIQHLIQINIITTTQLIHFYFSRKQKTHQLIFLSSVAACRGRGKNSLYGASKAAIEIYLEGLQQCLTPRQHICIARLGFIDTHLTYGEPGVFFAASVEACAKACWQAITRKQYRFYYPKFWRMIMWGVKSIPMRVYRRLHF